MWTSCRQAKRAVDLSQADRIVAVGTFRVAGKAKRIDVQVLIDAFFEPAR